jgi:aminopeptidase N
VEKPVLSVFRGFSAPVHIKYAVGSEQSDAELAFLMAHDSDSFNKWDAGNRLQTALLLDLAKAHQQAAAGATTAALPPLPSSFVEAMRQVVTSCDAAGKATDHSLVAYALIMPDGMTLAQDMEVIDPDALHAAVRHAKRSLALALQPELEALYAALDTSEPYTFSPTEVGRRKLRNVCLDYLSAAEGGGDADATARARAAARAKLQFDTATCMSEKVAGLSCLANMPDSVPERALALQAFYDDADGDALVINKWFMIQAMADTENQLDSVNALKGHPDFTLSNPNRARALIAAFAGNSKHFHNKDGSGYSFIGDAVIEIDRLNPQVAARLAGALSQWRRYDPSRQALMRAQLEAIKATDGLSKDTFEVVLRSLK